MMNNAASAYKNNKIMTASPAELTLMLYDGAVKFCNIALMALEKKDYEKVNRQAKKLAKNTKANPRELEYILRMARYIKAIDGKEVDTIQSQSFVEKLTGYDSAKFWNDLDKLVKCGIDTVADVTCGACNESYELEYGISSEFFRPKFE